MIDPFAGLLIIDAGGSISAEHLDSQSQNDQLDLLRAMIGQQRDPEVFAWFQAAHQEKQYDE